MHINGETFSALVIPEFEFITKNVADFVKRKEKNFLYFSSIRFRSISEYGVAGEIEGTAVALDELAAKLEKQRHLK